MAKMWTLKEDYIVCKFVDKHDVFISAQDLNYLVMKLKDLGFDRSKGAVNKRVYDYQHLLTGQEAKNATDQERTVAEGFLSDSQIQKAYNWIEKYVNELYSPNEEADLVDYSMGRNACDKSQYLPIQAVEVKDKFGWVLDDLLEKYYAKHQTGKKRDA